MSDERVEELKRLRDLVKRCDMKLSKIVDCLEDEGDRVFLGSTNDADDLRTLAELLEHETYNIMENERG